jgi:hypothetical protein
MSEALGRMVDQAATEQGWTDSQLSSAIGLLPGRKSFHAKQVGRLRDGEYKHVPREVVGRLIPILSLDPDEAWAASGLLPPGVNAEELRRLRQFRESAVASASTEGSALKDQLASRSAPVTIVAERRGRRQGERRRLPRRHRDRRAPARPIAIPRPAPQLEPGRTAA